MEAVAGGRGTPASLRDVWVREECAGEQGVSGRAVRSGAAVCVPVCLAMEPEISPALASWESRELCRICGEGTPAWAEPGPESVCWAFCV